MATALVRKGDRVAHEVRLDLDPPVRVPVHAERVDAVAVAEDDLGSRGVGRQDVVRSIRNECARRARPARSRRTPPWKIGRRGVSRPSAFFSPVSAHVPLTYHPAATERRQIGVVDALAQTLVGQPDVLRFDRKRSGPPARLEPDPPTLTVDEDRSGDRTTRRARCARAGRRCPPGRSLVVNATPTVRSLASDLVDLNGCTSTRPASVRSPCTRSVSNVRALLPSSPNAPSS